MVTPTLLMARRFEQRVAFPCEDSLQGSPLKSKKHGQVKSRWGLAWVLGLGLSLAVYAQPQGRVWAIVVGIDEYVRPSIPKLRYAVADAKLFSQALRDTLKVPPEQIFLMTSDTVDENNQPRFVNIAYRLSSLKGKVKKEDTLIFFFAGHGVTVDKQPYLLTEEADTRSELTLKASSLHGGDLISTLRKLESGNCWVMLDACRNSPGGGEVERLDEKASSALSQADVGMLQTATMFSCKVGQRSWEWDEKKHGCYSYFLVEGLRKEAADSQGRITLQGLADYVSAQVPGIARRFQAEQTPTMFYGGPTAANWVLTTVAAPAAAARSSKDAEISAYMAKLEALQARLDQETALRVKAEERANLAESQRQILQQQLAILEQQLTGKSTPMSVAQPDPVAYSDRSSPSQTQALEAEVARLRQENELLKKRLSSVEGAAAKVGMVSRSVVLENQPMLGNLWTRADQEQAQAETQARSENQREALQACLRVREALSQKVEVLATAYRPALEKRPGVALARVRLLDQGLQNDRLLSEIRLARLDAADNAFGEASLRRDEAEKRMEKYRLQIELLSGQLQRSEEEMQALRSQLDLANQKIQTLGADLGTAERARDQALLRWKQLQERIEKERRWSHTRSFEDRRFAPRVYHYLEANWADSREVQGDLPDSTVLRTSVIRPGQGPEARVGSRLSVHYTGWLSDGTQFDSSRERGTPFEFVLGSGLVIQGWEQGLPGMRVGETRRLVIPAHLAYGSQGSGSRIPPDAQLTYEIELLDLK